MSSSLGSDDSSAVSKSRCQVSAGVRCGCYGRSGSGSTKSSRRTYGGMDATKSIFTIYTTLLEHSRHDRLADLRKKSAINMVSASGCSGPTAIVGLDLRRVSKPGFRPTLFRHEISCSTWWNSEIVLRKQFLTSIFPYVTDTSST